MENVFKRKDDYDPVAEVYAAAYFNELDDKPLDKEYLNKFNELVGSEGLVCDLGCGPGQIGQYLKSLNMNVIGVDKSAKMIEVAKRFNSEIDFYCDDMTKLQVGNSSWAGIVNFYAIMHIPPSEIFNVLEEWNRVLASGGYLLLGFLVGEEVDRVSEFLDKEVDLEFYQFSSELVIKTLEAADFEVIESTEREPIFDIEYDSRRGYIIAKKTN